MVGVLLVILVLSTVWISQLQRQVEQRTRSSSRKSASARLRNENGPWNRNAPESPGICTTTLVPASPKSKVLANRGHRLGATDELTALFGGIAGKARELVTNLDIIVWAVDSERNSLESTTDYLTDFASECLSHSGIVCRFDIPVTLPSAMLDGRVRHDLLLAVKETLNNIVRHSQATEVVFRMTFAEDQFKINISDNGKGFDTQAKHGGHGLKNLPLRLSKVGGRYNIESCMGKGTNVSIELRVSPQPVTMPEGVPS